MKLNRRGKLLLSAMIGTMASGIAAVYSVFTFFLLTNKVSDDGDGKGNIGLRSYFHTGTGTAAHPFVITRPRHFYNLARLQNLGAFGEGTVFQLGYDLTVNNKGDNDGILEEGEKWLVYTGDSGSETTQVLNMGGSFYRNTIFPIGSEGAPFYGEFKGNNLVISNLTVTSFPEDVGVFGYTAPGSFVHDLFFKNLTVENDGWDKTILSPDFYSPATNSITITATCDDSTTANSDGSWLSQDKPISNSSFITVACSGVGSSYNVKFRSGSQYLSESATQAGKFAFNLAKVASDAGLKSTVEGNVYTRLSVCSSYSTNGHLYSHVLGTFTINIKCDGSDHYSYNIKRDIYSSSDQTNDSMSVINYKHGANIGFVFGHCDGAAQNIYLDGGSLKMNNGSSSNRQALPQESETGLIGELGASLDKEGTPSDAYQGNGETGVVNFTGIYNNIMSPYGTDGTYYNVDSSHNGIDGENRRIEFNNTSYTDFIPVAENSDDYLEYLRQYVGTNGSTHYVTDYYPSSYYESTSASDISYSYNLNFAGRKLVADTRDESGKVLVSRGLGVFKMATGSTDTDSFMSYTMKETSEFQIKRGRSFDEIFYTTAEYDSTAEVARNDTTWFKNWKAGETSGTRIYTPSTLPSFVTEHTWCPDLEKTSNYVFRTGLADWEAVGSKNYFANNKNSFLQQYFRYKLMNAGGGKIAIDTKDFGVKIQTANPSKKIAATNILSFDSYLYCKRPGDNIVSCPVNKTESFIGNGESVLFTLENKPLREPEITVGGVKLTAADFTYSKNSNNITFNVAPADKAVISISYVYDSNCPAGTINFSIKNTNGANVTVIAGASSEHKQYKNNNDHTERDASDNEKATASIISIYDKSNCKNGTKKLNENSPSEVTVSQFNSLKPSYSTYMPLLGTKKEDFRFFDYDYRNGRVNPVATLSTDEKYLGADPSEHKEILYAHTFKIPKAGDYFIYSPTGNTKLYYVCAQGQELGEIGDTPSNYSGENAIANIDFVRSVPGDGIYSTINQARYHLSFKGYWSDASGTMIIRDHDETTTSLADIESADNQQSIIIWNNSLNQNIYYNGVEKSESFITEGVS